MKHFTCALSLLVLGACVTPSPAPREPGAIATDASALDFSPWVGRKMSVEEYVKVCQEISGTDFTYTADTQAAMRGADLLVPGPRRITSGEFETRMAAILGEHGLVMRHVGPEHLDVILIERRAI
jgi:hypothetical protein